MRNEHEHEYNIEFAKHIDEELIDEATTIGITVPELIRFIIGNWVAESNEPQHPQNQYLQNHGGMPTMPTIEHLEFTSSAGDPAQAAAEFAARVQATMMAMSGSLSCRSCTTHLSIVDVKKGACHACSTPIFGEDAEGH